MGHFTMYLKRIHIPVKKTKILRDSGKSLKNINTNCPLWFQLSLLVNLTFKTEKGGNQGKKGAT